MGKNYMNNVFVCKENVSLQFNASSASSFPKTNKKNENEKHEYNIIFQMMFHRLMESIISCSE